MPQNSQFVKQSPATALRDSNDALAPLYWGGKSFMDLTEEQLARETRLV
jgi:hypothetical protein